MSFIKIDRYIFKKENIGCVNYLQVGSNRWLLSINYADGNAMNIEFNTQDECIQHFDRIGKLLEAQ